METLKRKLNSCRGASLLLALLFLLVCVMAGTSVLMAAASNAGKIRSNKEEQQKYLALISAVNLLCDELQSVEYVGRCKITTTGWVEDTSSNKKEITYTYTQEDGELKFREMDDGGKLGSNDWRDEYSVKPLGNILPLSNNWDYIVAQLFNDSSEPVDDGSGNNIFKKYAKEGSKQDNPGGGSYTLYLTVDGMGTVKVDITVSGRNQADTIILRASLDGYPTKVRATLEATNGNGPNKFKLPDPVEFDANKVGTNGYVYKEGGSGSDVYYYYDTDIVTSSTWELKEIVKVGGGN